MERLRYYADLSIRRGCSFGLLAIGTGVVGMASDMRLATKAAAIGMSLMVAILLLKAMQAPRRSYKRTELWILIEKKHGFLRRARRRSSAMFCANAISGTPRSPPSGPRRCGC